MAPGADPAEVRRLAQRLRRVADAVERDALVVLRAQGVQWQSLAADRCRARLSRQAHEVEAVGAALRDAAAALDRLATALEARQREIRAVLGA